jgi:hypothetical protein
VHSGSKDEQGESVFVSVVLARFALLWSDVGTTNEEVGSNRDAANEQAC